MSEEVEFSLRIEKLAISEKLSLMGAILYYCEINYIDVLGIVPLISKSLKDKLEVEEIEEGNLKDNRTSKII